MDSLKVVGFFLAYGVLYIGVPVTILMLVLRHHRRKTVELWLEAARGGMQSPGGASSPSSAEKAQAGLAKAWAFRKYPRT
jgi:hypothetical protein